MAEFWAANGFFLWLLTTLLVLLVLAWVAWMHFNRQYDERTVEPKAPEIEQVERMAGQVAQLLWSTMEMKTSVARSLQAVAINRYAAFTDTGGDQSFSIVMTDGQGNGLVLTSLHGRNGSRLYAKPLSAWESEYNLSDEELQAIDQARAEQEAELAAATQDLA